MDNKELLAEARAWVIEQLPEGPWAEKHVVHRLTAALEAAEAELTRRYAFVASRTELTWALTRSIHGQSADNDDFRYYFRHVVAALGAAPVSLEAANTTLAQVIAEALGWDWESAPGVPSPVEAVSDVAAAVEQHLSLEAVKAETTAEWGVRWTGVQPTVVTDRGAAEADVRRLVEANPEICEAVAREVTEWRPVETEGDNRG